MRRNILAAIALLTIAELARAGIMFSDIRPRDFMKDRRLDIHVGQLVSHLTTKAYEFDTLTYCPTPNTGFKHHTTDSEGNTLEVAAPEFIQGVTMYD